VSDQDHDAERQLVGAARAGDRTAFEELVRRHKSALYRFVRRYVGNPEDAYDILQETFVSAWLALTRFEPHRSFSTWLHTIALNKCRDHARRRAVRYRLSLLFFASERALLQARADVGAESQQSLLPAQQRRLDIALAELPKRYKEPLLLTLLGGLTHQQAAEQLGLTTKAVEMRIHRAKKRLREALAEHEAAVQAPSEEPAG
jgi:RNA polymerase sigma-70 factor (ECF subfamily)